MNMNIDEEHKSKLMEQINTFKKDLFEMANFEPN